MTGHRHALIVQPLPYSAGGDFWGRDAGLLARGFVKAGRKATLICLRGSEPSASPPAGPNLLLADMEDLKTAAFWKKFQADFVVLFAWTLPRYESIRLAIREAGLTFAERMDTDGMRSPFLDPSRFFYLSWAQAMDRHGAVNARSWKSIPSAFSAMAWMARSVLGAPVLGKISAGVAARIPRILIESPLALDRIRRWQQMFGHSGHNTLLAPHAVDLDSLPPAAPLEKRQKRVLAIGRWKSFQKNFPLALETACAFLSARPDYEFHFVGDLPCDLSPVERLVTHGRISREAVGNLAATSRIVLAPSRYESFHLAAAEALCCGCSVVMAEGIPTAPWFASQNSGTVAKPTSKSLQEALLQECHAWDTGLRHPELISASWKTQFSPEKLAASISAALGGNG